MAPSWQAGCPEVTGLESRAIRAACGEGSDTPRLARLPGMPTATAPARAGLRAWLIAVLAVAAVLGLIAGLGGFERRQVRSLTAEPGAEVDAGNLVFTFDSATVQFLTTASTGAWRVVVSGTVRNPHDRTLQPLVGDFGNLAGIDRSVSPARVVVDWSPLLGPVNPDATYSQRRTVPPDNRPVEFRATFRFDEFTPAETFEVGVTPMEYTVTVILGLHDEKQWNADSFARPTSVKVPLTRLPDAEY